MTTIENRQARHNYFIEDTLECGISLRGNEVKSIAQGRASIKESWVAVESGELVIKKMHIAKYSASNAFDVDEDRERKLLAHKKETAELERASSQGGYTLIPLSVYFKNGKAKVLVGVCKGKHSFDKRESEKKRDAERRMKNY